LQGLCLNNEGTDADTSACRLDFGHVPSVRGIGGSFVPYRYLWGSILQPYGGYANRLLATTLTLGR